MIELLKQAIDYIENVPDDRDSVGHIDRKALVLSLNQAIKELESQEPVAWMYEDDYQRMLNSETFCTVYSVKVGSPDKGVTDVPLYTTTPQRTAQEWFSEVMGGALFDFQEATGCDTAEEFKAQRTWVELTEEDLRTAFGKLYPNDIGILELAENNRDYAVEAIGARHHWTAFKAGARAGEAKLKEKNI